MNSITIWLTDEEYRQLQLDATEIGIPLERYGKLALKFYPDKLIENMKLRLQIAVLQEDLKKLQENKNNETKN